MLGGLLKSVGSALAPIAPFAPIIGAGLSYLGGRQQNVASAQAAERQMEFQREASDTSYQRQIADLKAAGINPMLVSRLGGASTPAGAMPQFVNPGFQAGQIFSGMQSSAASAQQAATQEELSKPQMELVKANTESIKEATKNIPVEGQRLARTVELLFSQTVKVAQETNNLNMTEQIISQTVKKLKAETTLLDNQAAAEQALDNLGREVKQAQPIIDLLKPFIRR
jgi:hypothetical protein